MTHCEVLLAEDDDALRRVLAEALNQAGLQVIQAADGMAACKVMQDDPRPNRLLICDIRMPRMDGFDLAQAAITLDPDIKILMITGHPELAVLPKALRVRDVRVLIKPFELGQICTMALELLSPD
jgi:two-component system cell cycle response regulator CpdR